MYSVVTDIVFYGNLYIKEELLLFPNMGNRIFHMCILDDLASEKYHSILQYIQSTQNCLPRLEMCFVRTMPFESIRGQSEKATPVVWKCERIPEEKWHEGTDCVLSFWCLSWLWAIISRLLSFCHMPYWQQNSVTQTSDNSFTHDSQDQQVGCSHLGRASWGLKDSCHISWRKAQRSW